MKVHLIHQFCIAGGLSTLFICVRVLLTYGGINSAAADAVVVDAATAAVVIAAVAVASVLCHVVMMLKWHSYNIM